MNDTLETDALANEVYSSGIRVSEIRMLNHARSLERERNELRRWTSVNGVLALVDERDHWKAEAERWRKVAEDKP